jgi:enamine deaminase RidA (YjgF/YER057c/UK114 family)
MTNIEQKLKEHNITIPNIAKPAASYVPYNVANGFLYISGQLPFENGEIKHKGIVGKDVVLEDAKYSAKQCAINILACIKDACGGDFDRLEKIMQLTVLVASTPDFTSQHLVANGASDFLVEILGSQKGAHTRAAFGIVSIPLNACVEIAAVVKLK